MGGVSFCFLLKAKKLVVGTTDAFINGRSIKFADNTFWDYQYYYNDADFINNFHVQYSYRACINATIAEAIGLPNNWYIILYFPSPNGAQRKPVQFAIRFCGYTILHRGCNSVNWEPWKQVYPPVYS